MALTSIAFFIFMLLPTTILSADTCETSKLTSSSQYTQCTALPTLSALLHYTYTSSNKTLSVAFTATPLTPTGFVAWGINPTSTGMIGTQALIAFQNSSGSSSVLSTYNLAAYTGIKAEPLSFEVHSSRVEFNAADGSFTIFAAVASDGGKVNMVWQKGPVGNGVPNKHDSKPENLNSKMTIDVSSAAGGSGTNSSSTTPPSPTTPSHPSAGDSVYNNMNLSTLLVLSIFVLFGLFL